LHTLIGIPPHTLITPRRDTPLSDAIALARSDLANNLTLDV
jgi:hypothetical protein